MICLHHTTRRDLAASIQRDGVMRAQPTPLYAGLMDPLIGTAPRWHTPPIVWLTASASPEPTVLLSERARGVDAYQIVHLTCGVSESDDRLRAFSAWSGSNEPGIPPWAWGPNLELARLAGSDPTEWYIVLGDLPFITTPDA